MNESMQEVVETLDPVSGSIIPETVHPGTLIPLKTTLELRDNLSLGQVYVTRTPTKLANDVVNLIRDLTGDDTAKSLPHLRRCSKPSDLPYHLKVKFMNDGALGRSVHTGKSQYLYVMVGPVDLVDYGKLLEGLSSIKGMKDEIFLVQIAIPILSPTSQVQANMWSQQFWQTVYRKNNPLGPHPSHICRTTTTIDRDADVWMNLAQKVARDAGRSGFGESVGAVIVKRTLPIEKKPDVVKTDPAKVEGDGLEPATADDATAKSSTKGDNDTAVQGGESANQGAANQDAVNQDAVNQEPANQSPENVANEPEVEQKEKVEIVALAGDARWYRQERTGHTGNPMAHAALRAISMVAQKLVRHEKREPAASKPILEFEAFQDKPLTEDEQAVFDADHPSPDGYLCHDLELYLTHEPCTMCSMAILHSRMGRIVFRHRMPLTGGMSSEDRGYDLCGGHGSSFIDENGGCGGGKGLGLHWRKELNWSMLGWEWESDLNERFILDPHLHA